ncbi:proline-rich basic protein 1 [Oxyura jamaicensis]|uniref:proline-rich basic protein 1 n=1 Tax=Oxyura jamaicensis TaxID=8884 RepID=UPI0015A556E8|nr:proline-rich basic protein 1 [Oxyura jamaicensis]
MIPRGKRDAGRPAELPGPEGITEGHRSVWEEDGRLSVLPRDDLPKSMSDSSVSSYHSALCSETTDTFKDCLEFLEEEDAGRHTATPPRGPPAGPPPHGPVPSPRLERARQAQLSVTAKNSSAPGRGGRMGPLRGDRPPAAAFGDRPGAAAPGTMLGEGRRARRSGGASDSDEADGEVRALTARSFRSLSGLPGTRLDMCSSHTSSSLSNSLSEDGGGGRRWAACGEPRGAELPGLTGKELFECVDVELESSDAKKGHGKKRTVPKRQIQLKRKERKETGFFPWGDASAPQPLPPTRKEPPGKGRAVGEDFRFNYKQFMKTASLDDASSKTRMASSLVKNVLAKKMQYEQWISKMEQKSLRGSSTSSGPSSVGTDLLGDGLEGKSSSLSKSDCSISAEDMRCPRGCERLGAASTTRPAKGVVLSEATRENVCKLKTTFNELNERMKYQEVMQCQRLPAEEHTSERTRYRRARALFEGYAGDRKPLDITPKFEKVQKPWPSLKQRAIRPSRPEVVPFEPKSLAFPDVPPRGVFTSRAQEVKLVPQSRWEEKPPPAPREPPSPSTPAAAPAELGNKGKVQIPQPRDVRKLLKNSYSLCFGTTRGPPASGPARESTGEPAPPSPLVIHCTSVCRREPAPSLVPPADRDVGTAGGQEAEAAHAEGTATVTGTRPARGSPVHITKVQSTRREVAATEGPQLSPAASPACRQRSELRVPPRAVSGGDAHVESHLHVLVGPRPPPVAGEGSPARSGAVLRTEKTLVLPPPPSPTEGEEEHGRGVAAGDGATGDQHHGGKDGPGDGQDTRAMKPAVRCAVKPPASEPGSWLASAGSHGAADGTSPAAPIRGREAGDGPSVPTGPLPTRPPDRRESWEHVTKWPGASEPHLPAAPVENSNYLTIPVKAPKSSPVPKLPSVPNPATASFGAPLTPHPASVSFGTPSVPNPATASFGTPSVSNPATASFGTPSVPHPATASFGTAAVPNPASTSFGTPLVPSATNSPFGFPSASSMSFGTPSVPNLTNTSFGTPLIPYPVSASFMTPLVPSAASASFGTASVPRLANPTFGTPLAPNLPSAPFVTPSVPKPASSSFGTPSATNPVPASLGSPSVPSLARAPLGTGVSALPAGESPWNKPFPEPPQPRPPEVPQPPAQPQPRLEDAPRRTEGSSPSSKSAPSPTRPFNPHPAAQRRMLVDPDSGKCYYMEPPRQPQLKTLYDPETGQYVEVLIPPVPVASHAGLYQAPFNPLLYSVPYVPYGSFPGLPAPAPPAAPSPAHPDVQGQLPAAENPGGFPGTFSPDPKGEGPPAAAGADCGYLESLYYIPTGMRASPGPGQPPARASPAGPEQGPLPPM